MNVLDATFLVDYLDGQPSTETFFEAQGGASASWVVPVPVLAEVLVGAGNYPADDPDAALENLRWTTFYSVDESIAVRAGRLANAVGDDGPYLDGVDGVVAAVADELDGTVVSTDGDLTHPETRAVVDVVDYRA